MENILTASVFPPDFLQRMESLELAHTKDSYRGNGRCTLESFPLNKCAQCC